MGTVRNLILKLSGKEIHTDEVREAVSKASGMLIETALAGAEEVLASTNSREQGLTETEALHRLEIYGKNETAHEKAPSWFRQLIQAFINPFVGILIILAAASFVTEYIFAPPGEQDLTAAIIIGILVLVSVLLTFTQEYQANRAADQLVSMIQNTTLVERRDKGRVELVTTSLVPGDIVYLSAGDIVPADVRVLSVNNLSINEAALTGESLPVEKQADALVASKAHNALDLPNIGYMGTNVVSGTARTVVIATGSSTYFGSMSGELVGHHPPNSFDLGIRNVSMLLIRFMLIMVPIIFLISGFVQGNWFNALLFGLAVAVGLTPEMLPTIITANLAKGTIEMARSKTIIKRLSAIQNLGAMNILCTDKTGTLTYDTVAMDRFVNIEGKTDLDVYKYTYLNSYHQTGLRNPLDEAVLSHEQAEEMSAEKLEYDKVGEIPFETIRRRMSVIVENRKGETLLFCKGAVDEMLSASGYLQLQDEIYPISGELEDQVRSLAAKMNNDGLRVLLVAYKNVENAGHNYGAEDEEGLVLSGLIGFLDPPKETAGPAIKALNNQGVDVRVITGDNEIATRRICKEIGFAVNGLVEGSEIESATDEGLSQIVENNNVFVRTSPLQKSRIISALKSNGHTVGFLGDGINDAPALRDADVGISVDNAVDIAKESAEIILLEKSLLILEEGVSKGRHVFGNIMKYIKMTVSSNFGNVFSVLMASIFIPFPPMLPLHLLIQNLLYDISQISIPWDHVDEEYLKRPQKWNPRSIARFTLYIGPVSSIFDFTTFALLWYVYGASTGAEQSFFQSGWFVLGLLSQTMIVHMIRTRKIPFIESTAARPVLIMTGLVMLVGLVIPFTPFGKAVGFISLPLSFFGWLFLTLLAYFIVMQAVKTLYIRCFKMWL